MARNCKDATLHAYSTDWYIIRPHGRIQASGDGYILDGRPYASARVVRRSGGKDTVLASFGYDVVSARLTIVGSTITSMHEAGNGTVLSSVTVTDSVISSAGDWFATGDSPRELSFECYDGPSGTTPRQRLILLDPLSPTKL